MMITLGTNVPLLISQIVNSVILGVIIFTPFLIGKDARQNGLPWIDTIAWACVSTLIFPIGLVLYCWRGRNWNERNKARRVQ